MSFNIEWTNADALTPSPFTVTKDGLSYRVELDAHYISDEEMQTLRRYITTLNDENAKLQDENARLRSCLSDDADNARQIMGENAKLRELVRDLWARRDSLLDFGFYAEVADKLDELGIEVDA